MKTLKEEIQHIELQDIVPDENQPRKYFDPVKIKFLKDSIEKYGIMNPITVEKVGTKYLLVDGERRFRAATELKLKEVPAIVISPQSAVDRLIQQFHIQEQHEQWTPTEKAITVNELSKELKIPISQLADMIGIDPSSAKRFMAFSTLLEKKEFVKNEMPLGWAVSMNGVINHAERITIDILKQPFDQTMRRGLERVIIGQVKSGDLRKPTDLSKLKDSFTREPKSIETFLKNNTTVTELFLKTKAQDAYRLRNAASSAGYITLHIHRFLESADAIPTPVQISTFKNARKAIDQLLTRIEA